MYISVTSCSNWFISLALSLPLGSCLQWNSLGSRMGLRKQNLHQFPLKI